VQSGHAPMLQSAPRFVPGLPLKGPRRIGSELAVTRRTRASARTASARPARARAPPRRDLRATRRGGSLSRLTARSPDARIQRRLSENSERLYESDNGVLGGPHRSAAGGRSGAPETEMAQRRIAFLSLMYKKSSDPGNSPTASTGKQASVIWAGVHGSRRERRTCAFCGCARQMSVPVGP
jgi:hypothetical protein